MFGESNGIMGWLPQSYVRTATSPVTSPQEPPEVPPLPKQLEHDDISQYYVAVYPYQVS